jgi:hypothetical protein
MLTVKALISREPVLAHRIHSLFVEQRVIAELADDGE